MNIKDKIVYARVKVPGIKEALLFNDGEYGIAYLLSAVIIPTLGKAQYQTRPGNIDIRLSFDGPIKDDTTQEERDLIDTNNRIQALCVPIEQIRAGQTPEMNALSILLSGDDPDYSDDDVELIREYRRMYDEKYRMNKSGDYIHHVKTTVESKFAHIKDVVVVNRPGEDWWQI